MKIWVICQYYKPEQGAPSARISGLAKSWLQDGHEVDVLTGIPNHPQGVVPEEYRNKPAFMEEHIDNVKVRRHWLYVTPNDGFVKKIINHLTFAASVLFANLNKQGLDRPEVIVASSPSFFCCISAWLLSKRYKVPFIMEVRDIWPGIFVELGVLKEDSKALKFLESIELFLYRKAAAVVVVTRGFAQNIADRGIPKEKLFVITNGVQDTEYDVAIASKTDGTVDKLRNELQINPLTKVVLYIGNHGMSQALGQIVDAARVMMTRSDVLFLFVGDGPDKERLKRIARGMPNVQFVPSQPKERVWPFYNMADMVLVPLKDIPGFSTFIPSKMFEIMACGKAQIGCVRGEAATIFEKSQGAVVVPPEDPDKLAKAISTLVDDPKRTEQMGVNGRAFVKQHYLHSKLARNYLAVMQKVVNNK